MTYNKNMLDEIYPGTWDGKTREMLVWNDDMHHPIKRVVVGNNGSTWVTYKNSEYAMFQHIADMPGTNGKKTTRRMTNRELAMWLKDTKGEKMYFYTTHDRCGNLVHRKSKVYATHSYYEQSADKPCASSIKVRFPYETEWHYPVVEALI